jgi:TPR repeat protein
MRLRSGFSRLGIGLGLVSAIALAVALVILQPKQGAPSEHADSETLPTAEPNTTELAADTPPTRAIAKMEPDVGANRSVPELQQRAEAGDLPAQFALGKLLLDCQAYVSTDPNELEDSLVETAAGDSPWLRFFAQQATDELAVQALLDLQAMQAVNCEGRELPALELRVERGEAWLERAASGGHTAAQLYWVDAFRTRWRSPGAVVLEAERVRVERERARAYLRGALAQALPEALRAQALAHQGGDLDRIDRVLAAAHWRAWRKLGSPGVAVPEWMLAQGDESASAGLDEAQLREAEREAQRLVQRFGR